MYTLFAAAQAYLRSRGLMRDTFHICVKKLTGQTLHTWHGMIGYIHKDHRHPHFR